jgi:hypothetical protein
MPDAIFLEESFVKPLTIAQVQEALATVHTSFVIADGSDPDSPAYIIVDQEDHLTQDHKPLVALGTIAGFGHAEDDTERSGEQFFFVSFWDSAERQQVTEMPFVLEERESLCVPPGTCMAWGDGNDAVIGDSRMVTVVEMIHAGKIPYDVGDEDAYPRTYRHTSIFGAYQALGWAKTPGA